VDQHNDHSTQELTRVRLKLHDELVFTPRRYGSKTYYHVEAPSRAKFYRIGYAEYTFISLLDGDTTVAEALSLTAAALGPDAFREREATAICTWLMEAGLAQPQEAIQADRLFAAGRKAQSKKFFGSLNPFWLKVPLLNPDRLLDRLSWLFGWAFSRWMAVLWVVLCGVAGFTVVANWDRVLSSSLAVFSPVNWIWFAVAWLLLKIVHEFSHAIVCRRYGGEVQEMGLILILFVPLAYVDVTSSWRFRSKGKRIHTAAAGIYAELAIAAAATIAWSITESAVLAHLLYGIMLTASVSTIVFNANPLMRFDGYYMLADFVEIPNLYSNGARYLRGLGNRALFGEPDAKPLGWRWRDVFVRVYGVAAFFWRLFVCASLLIAASVLFHGAGLILAAMGVLMWIGLPLSALIRNTKRRHRMDPATTVRAAIVASAVAGLLAVALFGVTWPFDATAPAVVEYRDLEIVRARSPGFVKAIHVTDGRQVRQGELLLELENDLLAVECRDLELAIEQARTRRRIHQNAQETAAAQVELENQRALEKRHSEKHRQLASLRITAPVSGRVMVRNVTSLADTYVEEGDEVLAIGTESHKQVRVSIAQQNEEDFRFALGKDVKLRYRSGGSQSGRLERLTPRARTEPLHGALCAPLGGPLAVTSKGRNSEGEHDYKLVEPRFTGVVEIPTETCRQHRAGELAAVTVPRRSEPMGTVFYRKFSRYLAKKLAQVKARSDS